MGWHFIYKLVYPVLYLMAAGVLYTLKVLVSTVLKASVDRPLLPNS